MKKSNILESLESFYDCLDTFTNTLLEIKKIYPGVVWDEENRYYKLNNHVIIIPDIRNNTIFVTSFAFDCGYFETRTTRSSMKAIDTVMKNYVNRGSKMPTKKAATKKSNRASA